MRWAWTWTWHWTVPDPANFGDNPVADVIRVGCVIAAATLVCVIGRIVIESWRRGDPMQLTQFARFVALAGSSLSLGLTELEVVGTPATPRLAVSIAVVAVGTYGVSGMRRKQRNVPVVHDRPIPRFARSTMSNTTPVTGVKPDPTKPFKAIGGALVTAILVALSAYFTGHNDISVNGLLAALGAAVVQFLVTYFIKNPLINASVTVGDTSTDGYGGR